MEYTYAALLLRASGTELNQANLTAVLEAGGCPAEASRAKALVAALEGVDLASRPRPEAAAALAEQASAEPTPRAGPDADGADEPGAPTAESTDPGA